jgi:hypothetical protein
MEHAPPIAMIYLPETAVHKLPSGEFRSLGIHPNPLLSLQQVDDPLDLPLARLPTRTTL